MLIQYSGDQTPLLEPEYIPLSIRTSIFIRAELGWGERTELLIASLIGQRVWRQVAEVGVRFKVEG